MSKTNKNDQLLEAGETFKSNKGFQSRLTPPRQLKLTSKLPKLKSYLSKLEENKRVRNSILERVSSSNEPLSTSSKYFSFTKGMSHQTENEVKKEELKTSPSLEGSHKRNKKTVQFLGTISQESSFSQSQIRSQVKQKSEKLKTIFRRDSILLDESNKTNDVFMSRVSSKDEHSGLDFETVNNQHSLHQLESEVKHTENSLSLESFYRKNEETRPILEKISEKSNILQSQISTPARRNMINRTAGSKIEYRLSEKSKNTLKIKNNVMPISPTTENSSRSFDSLLKETESEMREKKIKISPSLKSFYRKSGATRKLLRTISEESSISQPQTNSSDSKKKQNISSISIGKTKLSVKDKDATQIKNNFVGINHVSSKNETFSFNFQHTSQYQSLLQQAELEMREKNLKISPSLESFYKNNEAMKKVLGKIKQELSISQSEVVSSAGEAEKKLITTSTSDSRFSGHSNDACRRSKHVERDDSWKLIKVVNKKYEDGTKRKEIVIEEDKLSFELESLDSEEECSEMMRRISRLDACVAKEEKHAAECRGQLSVVAKLMEKQMFARLQEQKQLEDFLAEMKKQRNKLACDLGKVLRNEKRIAMRQKKREDSRRNKRIKFKSTVVELIGVGLMTAAAFAFNFI